MTYEIYRYIFIGGAILAGVMLGVTVLMFFVLKIPKVIGDLTGSNARKAIANIRSQNEGSGDKAYQTSRANRERGKLTDKISPSGRVINAPSYFSPGAMATAKISTQQLTPSDTAETETTLLTQPAAADETMVLSQTAADETTVLAQTAANETTVLNAAPYQTTFVIEYEITYIHTDEVIA